MRLYWVAVLLVACGTKRPERDDKPVANSTPPAPPRVVNIAEPAVAMPRELAFDVLDAGKGERRVLRYALAAAGSKATLRTELSSRELADGAWRGPNKLPAIVSSLDITAATDGHVVVRPLAGSIDGAASAAVDAYLAPWQEIAGKSFEITFDARGRLGGLADHDASWDELAQRLLATIVPVPDAALGEGARWRIITAFRQQGAVLEQTATYTLVSAGPPWKIDVDIQRLAERQQIGAVELVAIVRRLQGTLEIDPALPAPKLGRLSVESTVHVRSGGRENIVEDTGTIDVTATSSTAR